VSMPSNAVGADRRTKGSAGPNGGGRRPLSAKPFGGRANSISGDAELSTPPRLVELQCPACQQKHWEIDHDYRGAILVGQRELSYPERTYECPACRASGTGYEVLQRSPPAFLQQPDDKYPMSVEEFGHWLSIFRAQFPTNDRLGSVGISWYPGKRRRVHEWRLSRARTIGTIQEYRLSLSNTTPDDERIRVCVQGHGLEAHFWVDRSVDLDCCYFGVADNDLAVIRDLLGASEAQVRMAWERFSRYARRTQARWLRKLEAANAV
jgi:hypothetical protein